MQRGEFEVVRTDAKSTYVFTCASTLPSGGDNHHRHGNERSVVHGTQHKRLGSSSAAAGHRDTLRINVRQTGQEIEGADGIVCMQSHRVLQVQFGRGAIKTTSRWFFELYPQLRKPMSDI